MRFGTIVFETIAVSLTSAVSLLALDILPVTMTSEPVKEVDFPLVTTDDLKEAYDQAVADYNSRKELEDNLTPSGKLSPYSKDAEVRHQHFLAFDKTTADLDLNASLFLSGSLYLKRKLGLRDDQATFGLPKLAIPHESKWKDLKKQCRELFTNVACDKTSKFRTPDGTCNNLEHQYWGKSHSCMGRLVPPAYDDALSDPPKSKSRNDLPNVRNISLLIHEGFELPNATFTHMVMQFGQFVTHDITLGLMTRTITNQSMLSCCPLDENRHPECNLNIKIPQNEDDFFSNHGQTCMNFVRSALCNSECNFGPRQHSNRVTAYADCSNVYGNTKMEMDSLRAFQDGLLISQMISSEEYLPSAHHPDLDQCSDLKENHICFEAGDVRVEQQPALTSLHNLFLRQHNRLARIFKQTHSTYDDEQIFQLTRKVVNGQYQNVIYSEFLPLLLGPKYMDYFSLNTGKESIYEADTEATILNEFMSAAFRLGHTLVPNILTGRSGLNLDETYFMPHFITEGKFDRILKALASQPGKLFGNRLETSLTHTLYRQKEVTFGMDLASLNIQRGRDQGTAPYTKYIQHCFNRTIASWEDLDDFMSKEKRTSLQNVYRSPEDIDLFTGGVSEDRLSDAVVGPTIACIVGSQFRRLKFGDRFYFEHKDQAGSFTDDQQKDLRKSSLSQIICRNTKSIEDIVPNVFKVSSDS